MDAVLWDVSFCSGSSNILGVFSRIMSENFTSHPLYMDFPGSVFPSLKLETITSKSPCGMVSETNSMSTN